MYSHSKPIIISLDRKGLAEILKVSDVVPIQGHDGTAAIAVPITLQRRGVEAKIRITGSGKEQRQPDPCLCRLIVQARLWFDQLISGEACTVREIAKRENVNEHEITRVLHFAFLSPRIIEEVLDGRQAEGVTVYRLRRLSSIPLDWAKQAELLGKLD